ncbi:hypothetical protein E6W39_17385 [Kitasatospora acidiphila]|uniref:Uncharacterized protein n=1 Tax=Kitasatospora acidiphila TaxID=2567942 RepID=A0A540W3S0_9ACTN|nr:hypothetical protein [Kitasatospora acidiphila]TQF03680.1 hypothetical protein E6W39_17385 [Kitasatospora acidiphila]
MTYQPPLQPTAKGPLVVWAKVAICLVPLVTLTFFSFVPAVVLAARRKRTVDVVGAVVVAVTEMVMMVCAVVSGKATSGPANTAGVCLVLLLIFGTPIHFLLMDRRAVWERGRPEPAPGYPYPQPYGAYPQPVAGYAPAPPVQHRPVVQDRPPVQDRLPVQDRPPVQEQSPVAPSAPTDDLRELGELLRRQAGGDRR